MAAKVVVIGLDAAEASLIDRWCADGILPTIRSLSDNGALYDLDSHVDHLPSSVWPEISMGRSVGRTGQFEHPGHLHSGETRPRPIESHNLDPDLNFWTTASRAGRRVAVIDIPFTVPTPGLNGVQVVAWHMHDKPYLPRGSTPEGLLAELEEKHGKHPAQYCDDYPHTAEGLQQLATDLIAGVRLRRRLLLDVLSRDAWDLFVCCFPETHCAGHHFLHVFEQMPDKERYAHSPRLEEDIKTLHAEIDDAIRALIESAGEGADVILFTSHGMRPKTGAYHLLPEIMTRLGMHGRGANRIGAMGRSVYQASTAPLRRYRWNKFFQSVARGPMGQSVLSALREPIGNLTFPLESPSTLATVVQNNCVGGIRLNLAGRDPFGTVRPGDDADALIDEIERELHALEDPRSGEPVVARITRTSDVFGTAHNPDLPDLVVDFRLDLGRIEGVRSDRVGTIRIAIPKADDRRSGHHQASARLWGYGPSFQSGIRTDGGHVLDIAPTVLRLLDVPLPNDLDGEPLFLSDPDVLLDPAMEVGPSRHSNSEAPS